MLNEGAHLISVSGSLSAQWAATDAQSGPYCWSYQSGIKRPLPTSEKSAVVVPRTPLGLALPYQHTEAEKDLPLGGAPVLLDFKSLPLRPGDCKPERVTCHSCTPGSANQQNPPASAHKTATEQARRTHSMFYKTEVRLSDIRIACHWCSSLGRSKVSSEAILSEASIKKWVTQVWNRYQLPWILVWKSNSFSIMPLSTKDEVLEIENKVKKKYPIDVDSFDHTFANRTKETNFNLHHLICE